MIKCHEILSKVTNYVNAKPPTSMHIPAKFTKICHVHIGNRKSLNWCTHFLCKPVEL